MLDEKGGIGDVRGTDGHRQRVGRFHDYGGGQLLECWAGGNAGAVVVGNRGCRGGNFRGSGCWGLSYARDHFSRW